MYDVSYLASSALGLFLSADLVAVFAHTLTVVSHAFAATFLNPWQLPETGGGGRLEAGHPTNVGKLQGKGRIY